MTDSPTERIGRYQLLEPIGGGPNGSVWRAKVFGVAGFERQFAIKCFLPSLSSAPVTMQALSAAARSYGGLEHPRIARMSEFGVAQGQTFTAVELVAGLDAGRLVAESKLGGADGLPPGGTLALVSQIARAVGYAHGRGLSHLGLSPSNVIVTADGDIKVTDFGILAASIPAKPADSSRFTARIAYLAPEQLVGEATSAATDVYALGVIAYELVTGQRAFGGESPQAVAQAILAGPPAEPALPRPILRVLTRCLARSQFERFPDARALADALDAALRVAPVPGTRKDIGTRVKSTLDRLAAMNEGNFSGMVAIHSLAPPPTGAGAGIAPLSARDPMGEEAMATSQFVRPDVPVGRPAPLVGPLSGAAAGQTLQDLPRAMMTVPGLAPPPIPVPPGIGASASAQPAIAPPSPAQTALGLEPAKAPAKLAAAAMPRLPKLPGAVTPQVPATLPLVAKPAAAPVAQPAPISEPGVIELGHFEPPAGDEPATAPYDYIPEDHIADTLDGEARPVRVVPRGDSGREQRPKQTDDQPLTSPSMQIEVERGSDPDLPNDRPTKDILSRELRTDQMPAQLVRDLKRATVDADTPYAHDPLVELELEAHGGAVVPPVPEATEDAGSAAAQLFAGPQLTGPVQPAAPQLTGPVQPISPSVQSAALRRAPTAPPVVVPPLGTPLSSASNGGSAKFALPHGGTKPRVRAPSPSPPSLASARTPPRAVSTTDEPGATARGIAPVPVPGPKATVLGVAGPRSGSQTGQNQAQPGAPLPLLSTPTPTGFPAQPVPITSPGVGARVRAPSTSPANAPAPFPTGGFVAPPQQPQPPPAPAPMSWAPAPALVQVPQATAKSRLPIIIAVALIVSAGGVVAWWMTTHKSEPTQDVATNLTPAKPTPPTTKPSPPTTKPSTPPANTGSNATTTAATPTPPIVTPAPPIATPTPPVATGSGAKPPSTPTSDALQITSNPPGAHAFLDGADQGATPIKLGGTTDRHNLALILPGHDLYVAEIDGHGTVTVPLTATTPTGGPAGIKVIKCKDKGRYYVFVDGKPTGQTCPTERIECTTGPHTVEVYDAVTESRRKWDIEVTDTRLSFRVRVE